MSFVDKEEEYEGDWLDDKMHGNGVYKYADGSLFQGAFENGIKISGVYELVNGD